MDRVNDIRQDINLSEESLREARDEYLSLLEDCAQDSDSSHPSISPEQDPNLSSSISGSKLGDTCGVDGKFSSPKSTTFPPGIPEPSNCSDEIKAKSSPQRRDKRDMSKFRKRGRSQHHKNERRNNGKANKRDGGSSLVLNKVASSSIGGLGKNDHTCLLGAMLSLIAVNKVRAEVISTFKSIVPSEGDTPVATANAALATHNLVLKSVNSRNNRAAGV